MLNFFLPIYMKGQGLTDGQIGTVFGLMSLSGLLLMFPLGVLSDLFPPRRLVLLGVCIFIFYSRQMLTAESYWQFFLVAPLGGLAASTLLYCSVRFVFESNRQKSGWHEDRLIPVWHVSRSRYRPCNRWRTH